MTNGSYQPSSLAGRRLTGEAISPTHGTFGTSQEGVGMVATKELKKLWKKEIDHEKKMCGKIFDFTKDYVKDDVKNFKKRAKDVLNYIYNMEKKFQGMTRTGAMTKRGGRVDLKKLRKNVQRYYGVGADDMIKGKKRDKSVKPGESIIEKAEFYGTDRYLKDEKKNQEKNYDLIKRAIDAGFVNTPSGVKDGVPGKVIGLMGIIGMAEQICSQVRTFVDSTLENNIADIITNGKQGLEAFGDTADKGADLYRGRLTGVRIAYDRRRAGVSGAIDNARSRVQDVKTVYQPPKEQFRTAQSPPPGSPPVTKPPAPPAV